MLKHKAEQQLRPITLSTNTPHTDPFTQNQTRSIQSQTNRSKIPKIPTPRVHIGTNTRHIRYRDASTNTEPLIILSPDEITKLGCGATMITFNKSLQIFLSSMGANITPAPTNHQPNMVTASTVVQDNIEQMLSNQNRIKRKGAEINSMIQSTIKKKKSETQAKLEKSKLIVDKRSKPTKKVLETLTKKYSPLSSHLRKCEKQFSHILDQDINNESNTVTLHNLENDMVINTPRVPAPELEGQKPSVTHKADYSHRDKPHTVGSTTHQHKQTPIMTVGTQPANTTPSTLTTASRKGKASKPHTLSHPRQESIPRHTNPTPPAEPRTMTPPNHRLSPSDLVAGDTTAQDSTGSKYILDFTIGEDLTFDSSWGTEQWDQIMKVQYSPSKPEVITLDSDDSLDHEIEGENIDSDFKHKLLDLFGPVSP